MIKDQSTTDACLQNSSNQHSTAEFFMTMEQQRVITELMPKGFSLQFAAKPIRQKTSSFTKTLAAACPHPRAVGDRVNSIKSEIQPMKTESRMQVQPESLSMVNESSLIYPQMHDTSTLSPYTVSTTNSTAHTSPASQTAALQLSRQPSFGIDYDNPSLSNIKSKPNRKRPAAAAKSATKNVNVNVNIQQNGLLPPPRISKKKSISSITNNLIEASGMDSEDSKKCFNLLHSLQKQKSALPFLYPVDPVAQGCQDYFSVIRDPNDLSTIERNLKQNMYHSPTQFAADVRKIWNNSYLYNSRDSHIYYLTLDMDKFFERKYKEMEERGFGSSQVKNMPYYVKILAQAIQGQSHTKTHHTPQATTHSIPRPPQAPRKVSAPVKSQAQIKMETPMTMQEKKQLGLNIMQLPHDSLRGIWDIVKSDDNQEFDGNVLRFDLDKLTVRKTRELEAYVKQKMSAIAKNLSKRQAKNNDKQTVSDNKLMQQASCHDDETALTNNLDIANTFDTTQNTIPAATASYWMPTAATMSPSHIPLYMQQQQTQIPSESYHAQSNVMHSPFNHHNDVSESSFISEDSDSQDCSR